ncbi:MAG: MBL fold metallo-hydrolase [Chitinophagia bacterium]|nr:MBL fold metallo-hydrolase [Chitinophagia bacterium]NCA29929.1 MBL fold metallo-hydrolase [Chitinophagia bacterium]NDD15992.1 MBL fold metallo-hydrolase [Chitinophagia bacterium]
MLDITILGSGTSTGVPLIGCDCEVCTSNNPKNKRLRTSIKISSPNTTVVIDTTPDFRYQMLRTSTTHIDAVVFTHPHRDHYAGLDDIRPFNYFSKKSMAIYANELTQIAIKRDFYYAFEKDKDAGLPEMILHTIKKDAFTIGDIPFIPIQVMHREMPVLGFRIGDFTYITDANFIPETEMEKIKGSKVLILNALRKETHPTHYNLEQALTVVASLDIPQVYFTHFSHQIGLHDEVEASLPKGIHLAYDGLQFSI